MVANYHEGLYKDCCGLNGRSSGEYRRHCISGHCHQTARALRRCRPIGKLTDGELPLPPVPAVHMDLQSPWLWVMASSPAASTGWTDLTHQGPQAVLLQRLLQWRTTWGTRDSICASTAPATCRSQRHPTTSATATTTPRW